MALKKFTSNPSLCSLVVLIALTIGLLVYSATVTKVDSNWFVMLGSMAAFFPITMSGAGRGRKCCWRKQPVGSAESV